LTKLNYRVENKKGKELVVHVDRMKQSFKQVIWKAKERERHYTKQPKRQPQQEKDEQAVLAPRPRSIPVPQDSRQQTSRTPNRSPPHFMDTPSTAPHSSDVWETKVEANYVPSSTPRMKRELETTMTHRQPKRLAEPADEC
jgi:hypothetical protein